MRESDTMRLTNQRVGQNEINKSESRTKWDLQIRESDKMRFTNQRVGQNEISKSKSHTNTHKQRVTMQLIFRDQNEIGAWSNIIFHLKIIFCLIVLGINDQKILMYKVISSYNNGIWLQFLKYILFLWLLILKKLRFDFYHFSNVKQ